jgi:hypothetical protein
VPWLPTSAMASFLNMGEKVRRNSVSKTEFRLFQSRTDLETSEVYRSRHLCDDSDMIYYEQFTNSTPVAKPH